MGVVPVLLVLALLLGVLGLLAEGLTWILLIAGALVVASFFSYQRSR